MTTHRTDAPPPHFDRNRARSQVRHWPKWICQAAASWSLLYALLGLYWALGGAGFPFGGPLDDTALATTSASFAGPAIAAVGSASGTLALAMARGFGRGPVRQLLIAVGAILALGLTVVIPGHRPLMAVARTPLVLIGAPFGWPQQLSLAEFFASMYPWPVINELLLILGGLLWAAASLGYTRRTADACAHCGRTEQPATWTTPASARRWGTWAVAVAMAIPAFYALTRWAWALGIPLGFSREALRAEAIESPGIWLAGAGLATLAVGGALLTLGLIQHWGEVYPRWIPLLRGKTVHPRTAIIPATIVAVLVTSAGMAHLRRDLTGNVSLDWGTGPALLWPLWGAALATAALAYHFRRRSTCHHCHRS